MTRQSGFTLIELLVAMVAGSLLLATLSWSVATLGRELKASQHVGSGRTLARVAPPLSGLVEQMLPAYAGGEEIVAGPKRLAFTTAPPAALGASGPVRAILSVRSYRGGEALFAAFELSDGMLVPEQRLTDPYGEIGFAYARADGAIEGLPPKLVTISFADRDGRIARLAAAPRFNRAADCRFDPESMTCSR
jgi:prepilin-type N-terminal cleavage/methylation domain-containing protein